MKRDPESSKATSYTNALEACKRAGIPIVLTSSSRGEVTSLEYGPGRHLFEEDLCFFAGTLDADLVEPRLALLNHPHNRRFLEDLVQQLDIPSSQQQDIRRNVQRQLLSGNHYRRPNENERSDRQLMEDRYHLETRVDLLSSMHVKKALLASFLHECEKRRLPVPLGIIGVLEQN